MDTARTAEPKEYPIPYGAVLSNKSWGKERGKEEVTICQLIVILENEALLSWEWPNISQWEEMSEFPTLLCLYLQRCFIKLPSFQAAGFLTCDPLVVSGGK